jgi:Cu(I)/Ag(I) efflux system membrane protein CusA/SilA
MNPTAARLFRFLIRHRAVVLVLAGCWLLVGLWVALNTPVDAVPDLSDNQVLVYAQWPGQSPPEIERRVTRPLSLALEGLDGVESVRGSSEVGFALLHVIFNEGVPQETARRRVSAQVADQTRTLPEGIDCQVAADGVPTGQIFWYTVEGLDTDLAELRRIQDMVVAPQLRSVAGVAEVASVGGFTEEYHVEADLTKLAATGLTLADVSQALEAFAAPAAGQTLHPPNGEFLVRSTLPHDRAALEAVLLELSDGRSIPLADVARINVGTSPRRGVFEKDGSEMVAGIVHLRYGHNPLETIRAVRLRLQEIGDHLPGNVRLVPCYDRTPLIQGAVGTLTRTLIESLLVASLCIVLLLKHWRTSLVIILTLPLAALGAFLGLKALGNFDVADVETNIMSLAGIVVSIGVLVDSSIVVAENVSHQLRKRFGNEPVQGDVSEIVANACASVGLPAFFAILIMIVSFLPVFALQGIDGRMFHALAWTKTLALVSNAVLTVTLVPVLCATFIRGRVRDESESAIVRSVVSVYRPVLFWLLDHPLPLALFLCVTLILAAAATGVDWLVRITAVLSVGVVWLLAAGWARIMLAAAIVVLALIAQSAMQPIGLALRMPLDEGMIMDMPITVPRVAIHQAADDLKARNMVLCRFPEVQMVTGKAGRADTPFDPAPLDMIETMIEFRPRSHWPNRRLLRADAEGQVQAVVERLIAANLVEAPTDSDSLIAEILEAGLTRFDAIQREVAWQRQQAFLSEHARELARLLTADYVSRLERSGSLAHQPSDSEISAIASELPMGDVRRLAHSPDSITAHVLLRSLETLLAERGWLEQDFHGEEFLLSAPTRFGNFVRGLTGFEPVRLEDAVLAKMQAESSRRWTRFVNRLNTELESRAAATWTQIVCTELFLRQAILDESLAQTWQQVLAARYGANKPETHHGGGHVTMSSLSNLPIIDPHPAYDAEIQNLTEDFASEVRLWPHDPESLAGPAGEMDRAVQLPGWTNVWTRPIQNRVDMLATGVNSEVGIRVLGRDFDDVVQTSDRIAEVLGTHPGAADVIADPVRGKGYVEIQPDAARAANCGVNLAELQNIVQAATGGHVVAQFDDGHTLRPLRLKLQEGRDDIESLKRLQIPSRSSEARSANGVAFVPLELVADVELQDGPATIKSENGWLRNYVRLNVRDQNPAEFVAQAQHLVEQQVDLPAGVFIEWTGQYLYAAETRARVLWLLPVVLALILAILYATYRDWGDAGLMLLAVPGSVAGGILCQWALGFPFSTAVAAGYIACFGMAAATSIVMLVYLREAVQNAGGLENVSLDELRGAVLDGAVHRLRPKLLTEATTILSLAPMLWSTGVGADVIRPMAVPVLGGILVADEIVDLLMPVAFYHVRRRRWQQLNPAFQEEATSEEPPPVPIETDSERLPVSQLIVEELPR